MLLLPFGFLQNIDASVPDPTLALGPYAYWRMSDTGSTEPDVVNGNSGTYYGTPTKGGSGRDAYTFGTTFNPSSGLTIPDNINFTPAEGSVCGWLKVSSNATVNQLLSKYEGVNRSWEIRLEGNGRIFCTFSRTENPFSGWQGGSYSFFPLNVWTHLAVTFGSGGIKLYINGRLCSPLTTNAGTNNSIAVANNAMSLRIGNTSDGTGFDINGTTVGFNGSISDVAFFTRVLSNAEIQTIVDGHVSVTSHSYNPLTDMPGLTGWFDPQDAATVYSDITGTTPQVTNGGNVAAIRNLADGMLFIQSNPSYQPTLDSSGVNAPRSIRFNGHRLDSSGNVPITRFMAVAYRVAAVNQRHVIIGQYPNGNDTNFELDASNRFRNYYNGADRGVGNNAHSVISRVTVSAYHQSNVVGVTRTYLNAGGDVNPTAVTGGAITQMFIGSDIRDPNPVLSIPFNGYFCGAIFSSSNITTDQAIAAQHYLMRKCQGYL